MCKACAKGKQNTIVGSKDSSDCKKCVGGKYQAEDGLPYCLPCIPGTYQDTIGSSECKPCLPGQHQHLSGDVSCNNCAAGRYMNENGAVNCLDCNPGLHQNASGRNMCEACPIGWYSNTIQQTRCQRCEAGKHGKANIFTLCFDCLPGRYSDDSNATKCEQCTSGRYQSSPGQINCTRPKNDQVVGKGGSSFVTIAMGWYATDDSKNPSLPCQAGRYGTKPPSKTCSSCPIGYTSFKGNLKCVPCEAGEFSNQINSSQCTKCDTRLREYSDQVAATSCKHCTENQRSTGIECESLGIDPSLEVPKFSSIVINGTDQTQMYLEWTYGQETYFDPFDSSGKIKNLIVLAFQLEISNERTFKDATPYEVPVNNGIGYKMDQYKAGKNYTHRITLENPAYREETFVRLSASVVNDAQTHLSSKQISTIGWSTWNCPQLDTSYLDSESTNPLEWTCRSCPVNAYCEGLTTYKDVKARFGHWRFVGPENTTFVPCAFPAACLGAPTEYRNHFATALYYNLSISNLNEQCNVKEGYLQICDKVHNTTCR
jgi:hypothetical protein